MRHRDPGQNEKSSIVGDKTDVAPPRFRAPADVAVPAAQMTWRGTPRQARDGTALRPSQIFEVLPNGLLVFQIMMLLQQAVEQRLVPRAPHLLQLDGPEFLEGGGDRRGVDEHRWGSGTPDER